MTKKNGPARRVGTVLAACGVAIASTVVAPSPAFAADRFIDRGNCRWHAESHTYEADTDRVGDGGCAGHSWVRIKTNGSWGGWHHAPRWALLYPPIGSRIQQSQHKTCETCATFTLTP